MKPKNKAFLVGCALFILTVLATLLRKRGLGDINAVWLVWAFCSWNFFAYGFDKDMWPWVWVELEGRGKGKRSYREFYFWFTAAIYLAFLATMVFVD